MEPPLDPPEPNQCPECWHLVSGPYGKPWDDEDDRLCDQHAKEAKEADREDDPPDPVGGW